MQITYDQIQQWTTNPNQFVEEDECVFDYNVRISAQEFLTVSRDIMDEIIKKRVTRFRKYKN